MPPTITSQLHQLFPNVEVSFGTVVSATGFDFIDVFVDGSANPTVVCEWRLYELVGGLPTLVAKAPGGGPQASVLDWGVGGQGFNIREQKTPRSPAEGAGFTFELRAFLSQPILTGAPTPQFQASLIGYDEFDVVPNADSAPVTLQLPINFSEVTLATLPGYAQTADCTVLQRFNVPIQFTLYALGGPGGVTAEVARQTLQSSDGVARLFGSPVHLPGASSYSLRARFDSNLIDFAPQNPVFLSGGMATHSRTVAASGAVVLTGNVNGPSNANRFLALPIPMGDANTFIPELGTVPGDGWWQVSVTGLTAPRTLRLPAAPSVGEVVVVTDEDGSLAVGSVIVDGNGNTVEGAATFTMNNTYPGPRGSDAFVFDQTAAGGFGWVIFSDYAANAVVPPAPAPLPSIIEAVNRDVLVGEFAPVANVWYVGVSGLTADRTINIPVMAPGSQVIIKDEDGSLEFWNIFVTPAGGKTIDGVTPYEMTAPQNGVKGTIEIFMNNAAPNEWSIV